MHDFKNTSEKHNIILVFLCNVITLACCMFNVNARLKKIMIDSIYVG